MSLAVETSGLSKAYNGVKAVDKIDLKVPAGVICGFLGKNGAGKTTTIKMLAGLKRPTAGSFAIMGAKRTQNVGYLPDVPDFYGYMTGGEFLRLCGELCGVPKGELGARVNALLEQVGLGGVRTRVAGYSRGMRQRLGIAQALISAPDVILMDEPISALDPMGRRDVMQIISGLKGATIVLSTHILSDVESICDYIVIIHKGKIAAQDYMLDLKARFAKNIARVAFYEREHCIKFEQAMQSRAEIKLDGLQVTLRTDDIADAGAAGELSKIAAAALAEHELPFASFNMHAPSLDEIFYEMIGEGSDA